MEIKDEDIFAVMVDIRKELQALNHSMDARFAVLELELHGYRIFIKMFRWLGAVLLAIVTLKLGDIKNLF